MDSDDNDAVPLLPQSPSQISLKSDLEINKDSSAILEDKNTRKLYTSYLALLCSSCILSIGLIIFCVLWLSESQFGRGVLRPRYLDEPCDSNHSCVKGLYCEKNVNKCIVLPAPCSPYTDYYHYNNSLVNSTIYYCPTKTCAPCPTCPPPIIQKLLSYFDFNEFPNHWIDPGPQGFYDHTYNIPYGGCKEICGRDASCHGVCYNGLAKLCWRMGRYYPIPVTPVYNQTYTCAMKTFL